MPRMGHPATPETTQAERSLMPNLPILVARLFDGSDTDTRRVSREIDAIPTRFENQPRRRSPRARHPRH